MKEVKQERESHTVTTSVFTGVYQDPVLSNLRFHLYLFHCLGGAILRTPR